MLDCILREKRNVPGETQWFFEKCGSVELKVQIVEVQGESKKK